VTMKFVLALFLATHRRGLRAVEWLIVAVILLLAMMAARPVQQAPVAFPNNGAMRQIPRARK
jgi:hypothetical protein